MLRKHFRYHTGDHQWKTGSTLHEWESYVRKFFQQWPKAQLEWIRDSVGEF